MGNWRKWLSPLLVMLALTPLIYLFVITYQFGFFGQWREIPVVYITDFTLEMDGTTAPLTLPYIIQDGIPSQSVVLSTTLDDVGGLRLYFKSVNAPLRIYANDLLIYEYGTPDTMLSYLQDPPVKSALLELPDASTIDLRMEYSFPTARSDLILDVPMVGTYPSVFNGLLAISETHLALYCIFLVLGLCFLCIGLLIRLIEPQGAFFVWLGLITLLCGLWGFGEYDLTSIFVQNESLVSLVTFASVFYLPVPIHCFFRSTVGYHNPRPMTICIALCLLFASGITVLQATSTLSFFNGLPYFQWFAGASFCFGLGYTVYEWRAYNNKLAREFLIPWCLVLLSALVECIRFSLGHINTYGQFVQFALLVFIVINCVIGGRLIRGAFALREKNRRMEQSYKLMELQVATQQRYHHLLMENHQIIRQQRHDLHHQLAVIQHLAQEKTLDKLNRHLETVLSQIPEEVQSYCENVAVNAVVEYYVSKAQEMGVAVTVELVVPEALPHMGDNHLCVIFGNLLENAVEACHCMRDSRRFISLSSHIHNGTLVILQKNSFEGDIRLVDGKFHSSKRDELGIGLSSVESIAHKHGGNVTFTYDEQVFQSAVYVRM